MNIAYLKFLFFIERDFHIAMLKSLMEYINKNSLGQIKIYSPFSNNILETVKKNLTFNVEIISSTDNYKPHITFMADFSYQYVEGLGKIVNIGHGTISKGWFFSENKISQRENCADLICVPGEIHKKILEKQVFKQIKVTGMPKLDKCFNKSLNFQDLMHKFQLDPEQKTVLLAPTFNEEFSIIPHLIKHDLSKIFPDFVNIIIKLHGVADEKIKNVFLKYKEKNRNIYISNSYDTDELFFVSDLLISDVSSVIYEFLSLNKPILLFDSPDQHKYLNFNIDDLEWKFRDVGQRFSDIEKIPQMIFKIFTTNVAISYSEIADKFISVRDGTSTEKVIKASLDLLKQELPSNLTILSNKISKTLNDKIDGRFEIIQTRDNLFKSIHDISKNIKTEYLLYIDYLYEFSPQMINFLLNQIVNNSTAKLIAPMIDDRDLHFQNFNQLIKMSNNMNFTQCGIQLGYSFTGQNVDIDYIMPHCFILDRSAFLDVSFTDLYDDKLTIHEFIVDILKKKNNVLLAYDCLIRKMNYEPFLANNIDNTTVIKPNYNNIEPVVEEKIIIPPPPKPEPIVEEKVIIPPPPKPEPIVEEKVIIPPPPIPEPIVEEKVIIPPPPKPEPIVEEKVIIPPPPIPEPIVEEKVIIPPLEQQTTEPLKTATPVSENKVSDEEDNNEPGFVFINPPQNDHFVSEIKTEEFHEQKPWIEANIENLEQSSTTEPEFSPEESLIHNQNNNIESETIITNETDPIISNISQNTPKIEKETVPLNSNNETKPIKEEDDSLGFTFSDPKPIYYYHNHEKETTKEEIKDTKISDNLKNSPPKVNVNLSIEDDFDFISDTDFEKIKTQIQNQPFEDILAIKYIKMCFQKQLYDEIEQYALKIPGNIEIAYYRIYALERQGKIDKAFECIIDTDFSMIHENGLLVRFLVLNAKLLMKLNEPNDVIMSLNKALQYSSDDEEVLLTRGIFYISQEQFDKALNDFNKILSKNENNIRALKSKGVALQLMMKFEESNDCFYKIISKEIDNIEAMTEIVKNSFQTRDFTSIIEVLEKYIFLHDNNNDVIFSLAGIYCEINEDEKAIELLNKIMMTDNTYPGASELLFKIKTK